MSIFISLLISIAVQLLKYGIMAIYEARKLRRPDIRDKEGTRAYLENLIRWVAYFHGMFFADLKTTAFTLGVMLEVVKPGPTWDAFYAALLHDFNVSNQFPPEKYRPGIDPAESRASRINVLCRALRGRVRMDGGSQEYGLPEVGIPEQQMAEEYLALVRRLLDHPAVLSQTQRTWSSLASSTTKNYQ